MSAPQATPLISPATFLAPSRFLSNTPTVAPYSAKRRQIAAPIAPAPPVTMTLLPLSPRISMVPPRACSVEVWSGPGVSSRAQRAIYAAASQIPRCARDDTLPFHRNMLQRSARDRLEGYSGEYGSNLGLRFSRCEARPSF